MEIKEIKYIGSFPTLAKCPAPEKPEFAFIGRSNVGKSSLINLLSNNSKLAHVSKKPGKTENINFFEAEGKWMLIDLPGYGYAERSKGLRKSFKDMIYSYLEKRRSLACTFVLIDANVPPQKHDLAFLEWLGENAIPFVLVFTKIDRLSKTQLNANLEVIKAAILENWNELPQHFLTSAEARIGKEELLAFIRQVVSDLKP